MVYNSLAEKKVYDLIKQSSDEKIGIANETLKGASEIVREQFNSHPLDSFEQDIERIRIKIKLYEEILGGYDEIICQLPSEEDFSISDLEKGLKGI